MSATFSVTTKAAPSSGGGGGGGSYVPMTTVTTTTGTTTSSSTTSTVTGTTTIDSLPSVILTLSQLNFKDIGSSWAKTYINTLAVHGIVRNTELFNPDNSLTRAEFLKIVGNSAGWVLQDTSKSSFRDVSKTAWYSTYAEYALAHGIISSAQSFRPNDLISRAEVAKILAKTLTLSTTTATGLFSDVDKFSDLASYIEAVKYAHIFEGQKIDDKLLFRPSDRITRAEIAKVVVKAFNLY